jgi:lipid-A-disaccharide synthase
MTGDIGRAAEAASGPLKIFLVAVEESGDQLGAALMRALRQRLGNGVQFAGVGGRKMAAEGLASLHSTDDFSIMGVTAIPRRLPAILRHLRETLRAVREQRPHALVVIDSPGYSLWVAHYVRRADPTIKIIDYVSPSVWAWRPSRARSMRRYVDHVLALLPFEPEVHRRLGGPPCSYVGHPIIEQVAQFRPNAEEARRRLAAPPVIVVLPGSRSGEIQRLAPIFGETIGRVCDRLGPLEVVVPVAPHLLERVNAATASWPVRPRIVTEQADKQAAFRIARAALAKSGTVTLELALAGVPMVVAYKVSAIDAWVMRRVATVPSVVLANLVIGENVVPELLQEECTSERLAAALVPVIEDTAERRRQVEAFARLDGIMQIGAAAPALRAADIVLAELKKP